MHETIQLIELFKVIQNNPLLLLFGLLFAVGWYLKEQTALKNNLIVPVLWIIGASFGFVLISKNLTGAILGILLATLIIGFYEVWKNMLRDLFTTMVKTIFKKV